MRPFGTPVLHVAKFFWSFMPALVIYPQGSEVWGMELLASRFPTGKNSTSLIRSWVGSFAAGFKEASFEGFGWVPPVGAGPGPGGALRGVLGALFGRPSTCGASQMFPPEINRKLRPAMRLPGTL